jgi:hypothetical protein
LSFAFHCIHCLVLKKVDTKVNKNGQRKKKKTKRKF